MKDYLGMGIQIGLTALGIVFINILGQNIDCGERSKIPCETNEFYPIGWGLLGVNSIFNIFRSYSYNEPPDNHASNNHNGFNLAVFVPRNGAPAVGLAFNLRY